MVIRDFTPEDAVDLLISISEVLDTPVSTLLGETVAEKEADELKAISEKLEVINLQLARNKAARRKVFHWLFIALFALTVAGFAVLFFLGSPYLDWNFGDPETAVLGTAFHVFEWLFVRAAPIFLVGSLVGAVLTRTVK